MVEPIGLAELFDLGEGKAPFPEIFSGIEYLWDVLKRIEEFAARARPVIRAEEVTGAFIFGAVEIGEGTVIEPGAMINGPAIIGRECQIRSGAYVRGPALIGDRVVVGHASEIKNSLIHNEAEVPHFAYVGDSILGWRSHLGAGVKISNLKVTREPVTVRINERLYQTGLRKFGAIVGDEVEIGCNAVLNPGTIIGKRSLAYALTSLSGYYPPGSVIKLRQSLEIVERRD
ncbi:MAG: glucose-1-phosphate thymidylyltransferase [Candidatus Bipolaricaulia bacterium]